MNRGIVTFLVVGLAALCVFRNKIFATMPALTIHSSYLSVGDPSGDHASFTMNSDCEIQAASVGYQFNSLNLGNSLAPFGVRGIISFMDPDQLQAIQQNSRQTGTCMATYLNDCEGKGQISHLVLIPRDEAALAEMRHASIGSGQNFHLDGCYLDFQEGTLNSMQINTPIPGTGFFLVKSIGGD
jgi:hypothetical protein